MKLANHYYSVVSGLAASLGSFFGKMITYGSDEMVRKANASEKETTTFLCFVGVACVCGTRIDAIFHVAFKYYKILALKWFKSV
jgi:hypothetical protein